MKELLKGFWKAICGLASAAWDLLTTIIGAAFEFIDGVFETITDFFCYMFSGIVDLISRGVARLWVILFPPEEEVGDEDGAGQLREWLEIEIGKANEASGGSFSLGQGRFVVKTDNNNKIQEEDDIKAFFNARGSTMNGLDTELRNRDGIIEVTI